MKRHFIFPQPAFSLFLFVAAMAVAQTRPNPARQEELDSYRISVQSQLVEVFLTVTKDDRWIPNLRASDFRLTEDGSTVPIVRIDNQGVPLQIALLFDVSESIRDSLPTIRDAIVAFVESLNREDRIALVLFNSEIAVYSQPTDDREPILKAIRNVRAGGITRLNDAIVLGLGLLKDKGRRKAMVCFTDGQDTSGTIPRMVARKAATQSGYPIYAIGTGAGLELASLKAILHDFAEISGGRAFFIQNLGRLREVFVGVAAELRSAYVLYYYTQVPPDGRWHELKVQTNDPQYSVHSRSGFFAAAE